MSISIKRTDESCSTKSEQLWTAEQAAAFMNMPTKKIESYMESGVLERHTAYPDRYVCSKDSLQDYLLAKSDDYNGMAKQLSEEKLEIDLDYQNPFDAHVK